MHDNTPLPAVNATRRIRAWFRPARDHTQRASWQIERPATIDFANAPRVRRRNVDDVAAPSPELSKQPSDDEASQPSSRPHGTRLA